MIESNEQKLINIQNDVAEKFQKALYDYVKAYIEDDESGEGYRHMASLEGEIYLCKDLLATHFPELNLSALIISQKEKWLKNILEETIYDVDENSRNVKEMDDYLTELASK